MQCLLRHVVPMDSKLLAATSARVNSASAYLRHWGREGVAFGGQVGVGVGVRFWALPRREGRQAGRPAAQGKLSHARYTLGHAGQLLHIPI